MVERARLESECRGNPTVGSTPTLSAIFFTLIHQECYIPCTVSSGTSLANSLYLIQDKRTMPKLNAYIGNSEQKIATVPEIHGWTS